MCIEIWNTFRGCSHRVYQNTSPCHVARRCDPKDDMLLDKTKFLPDKQFKLPPGMLECKHRLALRPKDTSCPECAREQRRTAAAAAANGNGATATRAGGTPSSSSGKSARVLSTIVERAERRSG
ncbi:uncharacterized protein F4812DRAFT_416322 [Daldinia caldariorum]|uniref:uncharacterized protein n=1 Tax=Daldinia caldariorum TaxID=326644 RepID=UPI002008C304|nr:uncharacterized protein F4812DRAFT_416322 [Daldinia caldariorum]KAI1471999.1 hypothetical protein F4812DRAFT_416322 [Daldinia caldariorum]